jgi:hypothetical protein
MADNTTEKKEEPPSQQSRGAKKRERGEQPIDPRRELDKKEGEGNDKEDKEEDQEGESVRDLKRHKEKETPLQLLQKARIVGMKLTTCGWNLQALADAKESVPVSFSDVQACGAIEESDLDSVALTQEWAVSLIPVLFALARGQPQTLKVALDSPALAASGGLPPDVLAWACLFDTDYSYDDHSNEPEDAPASQRYLACVELLVNGGGAVVREADLVAACARRLDLTEPPEFSSNACLNNVAGWALEKGCTAVLRYLLDRGASSHIPWADACGNGRVGTLRLLHDRGALPSPKEAAVAGSQAAFVVGEGFTFAYMSSRGAVVRFLTDEVGYNATQFSDDGERHIPM